MFESSSQAESSPSSSVRPKVFKAGNSLMTISAASVGCAERTPSPKTVNRLRRRKRMGCSTVEKNGAVRSRRSAPIEIDVKSSTSVCGGSWRDRQGRSVQRQMVQG
jgi:hypothetical protein